MSGNGKVYILGVGPGDYKLMTLKAAECIGKSDVIIYDRLVNSKVLKLAKDDAELIYVGKMPDCHAVPQDGINEILVSKAKEGKTVARVKGGDPFMFGRGGEEAEALYESGIEFEIVPGVTSAISVPAYAGIPVTHRDFCSSLHIVTGHEKPGRESSFIDYGVLSRLEGTLIFLMGVKNLQEICSNLIKHGKDKDTPVAVIANGTTLAQKTVSGTLETISGVVAEVGIKSPAVTVIGEVVGLREKLKWYQGGRLAGKRVVVTRSREQASKLAERINELGGETVELPTIKITGPQSYQEVDRTLDNLKNYQWLVFTSINGVEYFFRRMRERKLDIRSLCGIKLCAVGEATEAKLNEIGLSVDYVPERFTTSDLLEGLMERIMPGEKVLLARADIASKELSEGLGNRGVEFEDLTVYRTQLESMEKEEILRQLERKEVDYITFTSSSTVKNFVSIIGKENMNRVCGVKTVCIGPVTLRTAQEAGFAAAVMADVYTVEGLINKLVEISEG
ncbi:MAG: uroporphyrinogen-III C-methyltransferase [Clostridia bacterium]|nr:uroporphyrinogen-III C-methyltransferase [Clostridia bacterium]